MPRTALTDEQKAKYRKSSIASAARWKKANPEKVKIIDAAYRERNRKKIRAYWHANKERLSADAKARRLADPTFNERRREKNWINIEEYRRRQRERKWKHPTSWYLKVCRRSAKLKGLAFDLDREWLAPRLAAGVCEMSGLPFDNRVWNPNSSSVDRIDPKGGYTKDNCRLILWWINRALSNCGEEYALKVFRAVFAKRGEAMEAPSAWWAKKAA